MSRAWIAAGTVADEAKAAEWIAEGNDRVEVRAIPGAVHPRGLTTQPDQWERRVIGFLDDALGS